MRHLRVALLLFVLALGVRGFAVSHSAPLSAVREKCVTVTGPENFGFEDAVFTPRFTLAEGGQATLAGDCDGGAIKLTQVDLYFQVTKPFVGEETQPFEFNASQCERTMEPVLLRDIVAAEPVDYEVKISLRMPVFTCSGSTDGIVIIYDAETGPPKQSCEGTKVTIKKGGPGNDTINGTSGRDVINGGGGADIIQGAGGNDLICGGAGDDIIFGGPGNDRVFGGGGGDGLHGDEGNDTLFGFDGDDALTGDAGDDGLDGGDGIDCLFGDNFTPTAPTEPRGAKCEGPTRDEPPGGGDDRIVGGAGPDEIVGGAGDDDLKGDGGEDALYGDQGPDQPPSKKAGSDTIDGGPGSDRIVGGAFDDILYGDFSSATKGAKVRAGAFLASVAAGGDPDLADVIEGGLGADFISGGDAPDSLHGYASPASPSIPGEHEQADKGDTIYGDAGVDVLDGGYGNDTLRGGGGDNRSNAGRSGGLLGGPGNDVLRGGDGNDGALGGEGNDKLFGDDGDDGLRGEAGNDQLLGGKGVDDLNGQQGNDLVSGGPGADKTWGGSGTDECEADPADTSVNGCETMFGARPDQR